LSSSWDKERRERNTTGIHQMKRAKTHCTSQSANDIKRNNMENSSTKMNLLTGTRKEAIMAMRERDTQAGTMVP